MKQTKHSEEVKKLKKAVDALEAQRATLGNAVVDAALIPIRNRLNELRKIELKQTLSFEGERKLVTILFADISGFTALSETMDPEIIRELINNCFNVLVPIIEKYEGVVDKFIGDEIMALFGAPVVHENDPERALQAALEMMDRITAFNADHNIKMNLHIGINTGLVIAGGIGSENRQQYSVMGDPVNLASRLKDASDKGEIYVGPHTYKLTSTLFHFEPLKPIKFKGKAKPLATYRLIASKEIYGKVQGIEGLHSTLVGRDTEIGQLQAAISALQKGQGSIISIISEAGLGKSRLVTETRQNSPSSVAWAEGRALSYTRGMSYWVARDILRGLLNVKADTPLDKIDVALRNSIKSLFDNKNQETVLPYLAHLLDLPQDKITSTKIAQYSPIELQKRINKAFSSYVSKRSEQPLVLVWEDLHWADISSLKLIEMLIPFINEVSLILMFVFRPEEGPTWDFYKRVSIVHAKNHTVLKLQPLNRDNSINLLKSLLKIENLPMQIQTLIVDKAEGNPLFIEEILRSLIDAGIVLLKTGRIEITDTIQHFITLDIPDTVQGVIAARIDRLPSSDKYTLQTAAIIGRIFQKQVLKYMLDKEQSSDHLDISLDQLRRHEFIRIREAMKDYEISVDQEYIFKHILTREMAYNSILITRRKELHRVAGEAIETLFPERLDELSATVAYHFEQADVLDKAIAFLHKAGNHAVKLSANDEAVRHFSRGLELLQIMPDNNNRAEQKLQLQLPLAVSLMNLNGYGDPEVKKAFDSAYELCNQIGDTPQIAIALHGMGAYYCAKMEYKTVIELADRIIRIAQKAPDPIPLLLVGHNGQSANMTLVGESEQALRHAQQVFNLYDPQKHRSLVFDLGVDLKVVSMSYSSFNLWLRGYPKQAREISRDALVLCRELAHPPSLCFALQFASMLSYFCRNEQNVQKYTDELFALTTEYGFLLFLGYGTVFKGWFMCQQGQTAEGLVEMRQGLALFDKAGAKTFQTFYSTLLAEEYKKVGYLDEGLAVLEEGFDLVEKKGERFYEAEIHRLMGELTLLHSKNEATVEKHYMKAIKVAQRQSAKSLELRAVMSLCRLWEKQGKKERALKMLKEIYDWFTEGFDTADLKEAKLLLKALSKN